jgi:phospholipid/cholesterol/gamma-HCH transport system substrate-binding protein
MPRTRSIVWSELKLGIIGVVALVLAALIIVAVGGEGGFFPDRYPLKARFPDAQGLTGGALVRLSGKDVGTVLGAEFQGAEVEISMELNEDVRPLVTTESIATIGSLSLLGESMITIKAAPTGAPLPDWGYVRTEAPVLLTDVTTRAASGLQNLNGLIADLRAGKGTAGKLFTDEALYRELESLVASAGAVARQINAGKGTIGQLLNDPAAYNALKKSLEDLQTMTARINAGEGALGRFLNDEAMGQSLSNSMANLEKTTAQLARSDGTMGKLLNEREVYDRLNSTLQRVEQIATNLNQGEGTAGKLLNDRQLYDQMNRAVGELGNLLAEIKKDPRRYLQIRVSIF